MLFNRVSQVFAIGINILEVRSFDGIAATGNLDSCLVAKWSLVSRLRRPYDAIVTHDRRLNRSFVPQRDNERHGTAFGEIHVGGALQRHSQLLSLLKVHCPEVGLQITESG